MRNGSELPIGGLHDLPADAEQNASRLASLRTIDTVRGLWINQ
jgi:hypothetical protein